MKLSTCLESAICMKTEYDKILTGSFSPPEQDHTDITPRNFGDIDSAYRPRNSLTPAAQVRRLSMSANEVINVSPLQEIIKSLVCLNEWVNIQLMRLLML